jgi:hypothetical protein
MAGNDGLVPPTLWRGPRERIYRVTAGNSHTGDVGDPVRPPQLGPRVELP